jgi:translation initiation factor 2-alpha kinase 4
MAPTNPWGKKKPQDHNASSPGFPGPKSTVVPKSQYEEIQEDELIALSSIYGEDFRRVEKNHVAWKVY